jgi:16S rRNA (guanine527-N7)-methyltransferase
MQEIDPRLHKVLVAAQDLGYIGPAPLTKAIAHAEGFATGLSEPPARFVDLGSGGGLPGLVLLLLWPASHATLIDGSTRRAAFLDEAVEALELGERAQVVAERAEVAGRNPDLRYAHDLVVARSFGPPAVTAECASPFLRIGGTLVVSEPPTVAPNRWPPDSLALLGLTPDKPWSTTFHYQPLLQSSECPTRYPRRTGIPTKRPLF